MTMTFAAGRRHGTHEASPMASDVPGKVYAYRQDLLDFLLTLIVDLTDFARQHPEAVAALVGLWFEVRGLVAEEKCKRAGALCPFGVANCGCQTIPF